MYERCAAVLAAGLSLIVSSSVVAQDDAPQVDVRFAGIANVQPAEKDAAAHQALLALGSRLRLLPREIPDFQADRKWIDAAWRVATGGFGYRVTGAKGMPSSLVIAPQGGADQLQQYIAQAIESLDVGEIVTGEDGVTIDTGVPDVLDIVLHTEEVDGRSVLHLSQQGATRASIGPRPLGLPTGSTPIFSMEIAMEQLVRELRGAMGHESPEAEALFEELGLFGAVNSRVELAFGTSPGGLANAAFRLTEARPWLGMFFGEAAFDADEFRAVPRDATLVGAACVDLSWTLDVVAAVSEDTGRDIIREVREGFGIDLGAGVLANIGPRWMFYQSDTTGGGGVLSSVLIAELRDPEAFASTHAAALVHVNQAGSALGRGYARTREWQLAGVTAWSAVFPGLPVPLEPSWAIAGDRLVIAATPAGLSAALGQLTADGSLLDNPLFQQAVTDLWPGDPVVQVSFVDTARFAAKGYGPANLVASALANAARQPFNAAAEPGIIMPSFARFTEGVRPTGAITSWNGDDLVQRASLDSSALVQVAAALGQSSGWQSMYVPAMGAGVLLPALGKARASAQQIKSSTQLRAVIQGAIVLHQDDPNAPISIDRLLEAGLITEDLLASPMGAAWDGGPDIVLRETFGETGIGSFDSTLIVAMDRAMYVNGNDIVNIGFADGHVEAVSYWEVGDSLDMPKNAGLREAWGLD